MIKIMNILGETKVVLKKIPFEILYPTAHSGNIPKEWSGNFWYYPGTFIKISGVDYIEFGRIEKNQEPDEYGSHRGDVLIRQLKKAGIPYIEEDKLYGISIYVNKKYFDIKVTLGETKIAPKKPFVLFHTEPEEEFDDLPDYILYLNNDPNQGEICDFYEDDLKYPYLKLSLPMDPTWKKKDHIDFLLKATRGLSGVEIKKYNILDPNHFNVPKNDNLDYVRIEFKIPLKYFKIKNND